MAHDAGKGDAPRKTADPKKYAEVWERVFGRKIPPSDTEDNLPVTLNNQENEK